jgi:hypothetical protein
MELHPLLSQLDKTDLEKYMSACKDSVPKSSDKSGVTSLHKIYNFAIM